MSVIGLRRQSASLHFHLDNVLADIGDSGFDAVVDETLVPLGVEHCGAPTAAVLEADIVW